jgi:hypothetical protein
MEEPPSAQVVGSEAKDLLLVAVWRWLGWVNAADNTDSARPAVDSFGKAAIAHTWMDRDRIEGGKTLD